MNEKKFIIICVMIFLAGIGVGALGVGIYAQYRAKELQQAPAGEIHASGTGNAITVDTPMLFRPLVSDSL